MSDLVDFVCDPEVDIVVITETWLKSGDSAVRIAATSSAYRLFDHPRPDRNDGGTGILARDSLVVNQARAGICDTFEYSEWIIVSGSARPSSPQFAWLSSTGRRTLQVIHVLWVCSSQNSLSC